MKLLLVAATALTLSLSLAACTTYEPGEMQGGTEVGTMAGPGDSTHSLGSDKADGMGRPIAGGDENVEPRKLYTRGDSMWTSRAY